MASNRRQLLQAGSQPGLLVQARFSQRYAPKPTSTPVAKTRQARCGLALTSRRPCQHVIRAHTGALAPRTHLSSISSHTACVSLTVKIEGISWPGRNCY